MTVSILVSPLRNKVASQEFRPCASKKKKEKKKKITMNHLDTYAPNHPPGGGRSWRALDQLPRLPRYRPRELTPPGLRGTDSSNEGPTALFQQSLYFKLPPNIRRDILRLAFGDRPLHVNLSFSHPDTVPIALKHRNHCGIDSKESLTRSERERIVDANKPKSWRWWSSTCHRLPPNAPVEAMTRGGPDGPWDDNCRNGQAEYCLEWRDEKMPSLCHIGIMGWLLSLSLIHI